MIKLAKYKPPPCIKLVAFTSNRFSRPQFEIIVKVYLWFYRPELCPEKRMLFYPNLPKIIGSDCLEGRLRSIHRKDGGSEACHVFGHTHFCWDAVLDGIRYDPYTIFGFFLISSIRIPVGIFAWWDGYYTHTSSWIFLDIQYYIQEECYSLLTCRYVQAPLAYPRERKRRMNGGEDWLPFCIYYDGHLEERLSPCYWSDYYSYNKRQPENTKLAPWVARFYSR